jgi:hypothetical protein
MKLEPKQVICKCGHTFSSQREKTWCEKCCRPVFYYARDKKINIINTLYFFSVMSGVLVFIAYLFIELVAAPLLSFK